MCLCVCILCMVFVFVLYSLLLVCFLYFVLSLFISIVLSLSLSLSLSLYIYTLQEGPHPPGGASCGQIYIRTQPRPRGTVFQNRTIQDEMPANSNNLRFVLINFGQFGFTWGSPWNHFRNMLMPLGLL